MRVDNIALKGFRNIRDADIALAPGTNVICGENAQGKTNLLEAVFMLAGGRSFRTRRDSDIIAFSEPFARLDAAIFAGGRSRKLSITLARGQKKTMELGGVKISAAELSGALNAVLFCPEDLRLVTEGPEGRRSLLDTAISQLRPGYATALAAMRRNYEQKKRILRDWRENPSLLSVLDEFTAGLLRASASLIRYRAAFIDRLAEAASEIHRDFSGQREELRLEYKTCSNVSDPRAPASEIYERLLQHSASKREAELALGQSLTGAHRDDILIYLNGTPARGFASQGQTRTAALSIKLAEREIFLRETGEYPVLLLDDVLSELDATRQEFVLRRITGGQTLITCCESGDIAGRTDGHVITVKNGEFL